MNQAENPATSETFFQRLIGVQPLDANGARRLRIWPALLLALVVIFCVFGIKHIAPGSAAHMIGMMVAPLGIIALYGLWILLFSRAPWFDRIAALIFTAIGIVVSLYFSHETIAPPDQPPLGLIVFGVPLFCGSVTLWLLATRRWPWNARRITTAILMVAACLFWILIRCDGLDGFLNADMSWRWSPTPEQISMQRLESNPATAMVTATETETTPTLTPLTLSPGDWPCFRNTHQDGRIEGATIATDWEANPPLELWRHPIGLGWSSFSVVGDYLYTQEQRGDDEAIVAYHAETGEPIWQHSYPARFYETVAGAGPRGTPTFHEGRVYSTGATGVITCLDATTGKAVWTRSLEDDVQAEVPEWGFSSSPLIVNGLAIVYGENAGLVAYDLSTGELKWQGDTGRRSYSSAQLENIGGVDQILMLTGDGLTSLSPTDGVVLWEHEWPIPGMSRVVQPSVLKVSDTDSAIFIGTGYGNGTRCIVVSKDGEDWNIDEEWTSRHLKPYFNDFVLHNGFLYGFDGNMLACIDGNTGKRQWKMRGYGHGQLVLLLDQELLLVISETGELALVKADYRKGVEIAKMPSVSGKTWNHPVIAHGKLFVRNGEEAVCYQLDSN